ncbi:MAG: hypothetical protein ABL893_12915 [Hyphomicrobium sp.]|nr:hypothetical protein [Hyphomicrobium sp.]
MEGSALEAAWSITGCFSSKQIGLKPMAFLKQQDIATQQRVVYGALPEITLPNAPEKAAV